MMVGLCVCEHLTLRAVASVMEQIIVFGLNSNSSALFGDIRSLQRQFDSAGEKYEITVPRQ